MQIVEADSGERLASARALFREYADSLQIDLCFQDFEQELRTLPGKYALPRGRLLLALNDSLPIGCVGLRPMQDGAGELKRLYVKTVFRNRGAGRALAKAAIDAARQIGYRQLRLDTLASMVEAIRLYESLGFQGIPPYYDNPCGSAVFMSLAL